MSTTSLTAALIALCCAVPAAAQTAKMPATHAADRGAPLAQSA
jgi:hypothetical protein